MRRLFPLLFLFSVIFVAGCDEETTQANTIPEIDESAYKQAQKMAADNNPLGAKEKYLQVIDSRRDAAESHLEVGRIYLENLKQPLDAIYHFRQFNRLREGTEQTKNVAQLIRTAEKLYIGSIAGRPPVDDTVRIEAMDKFALVKGENEVLKQRVAVLQEKINTLESRTPVVLQAAMPQADSIASIALAPARPAPQPLATGSTYTVKSGDTLYKISISVYGTSNRWKEILNANRDKLASERSPLRVGMELKIPR